MPMKTTIIAALALLAVSVPAADLREAQKLIKENQPAKAGELLRALSAKKPNDPWLVYDTAVAAYAANDYETADKVWAQLATTKLPGKLRDEVWAQIGNVSFRKGELVEEASPEEALPKWEQSLEAYRVALSTNPRDKEVLHNKHVVELKLARLHQKLAKKLLDQHHDEKQAPIEKQIEKLQAALDHQETAQKLDPKNEELKKETQETKKELSDKFQEKAENEEKKADPTLEKADANKYEQKKAEEELQKALADFKEAKEQNKENKEAKEGEKRVEEKLAKLLTKEAQELQKEGEQQAQNNPEQAQEKLEKALDKFQEAQEHDPKSEEAKTGEEEVKKDLEALHIEQGDKKAEAGEKDAPNDPAKAAEEKLEALQHFEEALAINPENQEAKDKAEAVEKGLGPLLDALGKSEQEKADKAEGDSPGEAAGHLEKAAASFGKAEALNPGDQEAKEGAEKAQQGLARLRAEMAKKAEQQKKSQAKMPPENPQSFSAMLAEMKKEDKQREFEAQRRQQPEKYHPQDNKNYKNY